MREDQDRFPEYFPDGCPPEDAEPGDILVYRMCENNPANEQDFLSHVLKFPAKDYSRNILAHGVSVFIDVAEMIKFRNSVPAFRKRMKYTSFRKTFKDSGVIKSTPEKNKSHLTWWLYKDFQPHTIFQMYEEEVEV
jgi:hypothetical protein